MHDFLTVFELTMLVLVLFHPGFARSLAKLLVTHAGALEKACHSYRQSWNGSHRRQRTKDQEPIPAAPRRFFFRRNS